MASRPVFVPNKSRPAAVQTVTVQFDWHPGFAPIQKQRNIHAIHASAAVEGIAPILEVSTKSGDPLGVDLSAFNLHLVLPSGRSTSVEAAFQGSKVFECGGPYQDLYDAGPHKAKKDERLRSSGALVGFTLESRQCPLEPKTLFYDWIYARAVAMRNDLAEQILGYRGFTDIEFNPRRSINCQARACAIASAMHARGELLSNVGTVAEYSQAIGLYPFQNPGPSGEQAEWPF